MKKQTWQVVVVVMAVVVVGATVAFILMPGRGQGTPVQLTVRDSGFSPLKQPLFFAVPKDLSVKPAPTIPLLGKVMLGYASLGSEPMAVRGAPGLRVAVLLDTGMASRAPQAREMPAQGSLIERTRIGAGIDTATIPISDKVSLAAKLGANGMVAIRNPRIIEADLLDLDWASQLKDIPTGANIYLINKLAVADLTRRFDFGAELSISQGSDPEVDPAGVQAQYKRDFRAIGAVLGFGLLRLERRDAIPGVLPADESGRHRAEAFRRSFFGGAAGFSIATPYKHTLSPPDQANLLFANPFEGGIARIRVSQPGTAPTLVEGTAVTLAPGIYTVGFAALSANQLFTVALDLTVRPDGTIDEVPAQRHAALLSWTAVTLESLAKEQAQEQIREEVEELGTLIDRVFTAVMEWRSVPVIPTSPFPQPLASGEVAPDQATEFKRLSELVDALSRVENLSASDARRVRLASTLRDWVLGRGEAPTAAEVDEAMMAAGDNARLAVMTAYFRAEDAYAQGKWQVAAECYERAMVWALSVSDRVRLASKRGSSLYHHSMSLNRSGDKDGAAAAQQQLEAAIRDLYGETTLLRWDGPPSRSGIPEPWVKTVYVQGPILHEGHGTFMTLASESSSFALSRPVNIDPFQYPILTWRWMAHTLPPRGDMREGKTDDQALQVIVTFVAADGSLRVINYGWDSNAPRDTRVNRSVGIPPVAVMMHYIAVATGEDPLNTWLVQRRNLLADFRDTFGDMLRPRRVLVVTIQSNTQYTEASAKGSIGQLEFQRDVDSSPGGGVHSPR